MRKTDQKHKHESRFPAFFPNTFAHLEAHTPFAPEAMTVRLDTQ